MKKIKLKGIRKVCGLTKEIRKGNYVQVSVDVTTGQLYATLFLNKNSYNVYEDKHIRNIYNIYKYESMKDLRRHILRELLYYGFDNFE